jgi:hypothetical protein
MPRPDPMFQPEPPQWSRTGLLVIGGIISVLVIAITHFFTLGIADALTTGSAGGCGGG